MKIILFFLVYVQTAHAEKILYNLRNEQVLVEVGLGGGVTSEAEVVWRESRDGPFPADAAPLVGYAERFTTQELQDGPNCSNADDIKAAVKAKQKIIPDCVHIQVSVDVPHLRANATMLLAYQAAQTSAAKAAADAAATKAALIALKIKIKAKTATAADVRDALGAMMDSLNLGN